MVKGVLLVDIFYILESFNVDKKNEIIQCCIVYMSKVVVMVKGLCWLMIVIGEVKEVVQFWYGYKIVFKYLFDCYFMMNDDLYKCLFKCFEVELGLWDVLEDMYLMVIGMFSVGNIGIVFLEEVVLMLVMENWIFFESIFDQMVIDVMSCVNWCFMKGMCYNLLFNWLLVCFVVLDILFELMVMYVLLFGVMEDYVVVLIELMNESKFVYWFW